MSLISIPMTKNDNMNNSSYIISEDGAIFSINKDGSIDRLAKIDANGAIYNANGEILVPRSRKKWILWLLVLLFALIAIGLGFLCIDTALRLKAESESKQQVMVELSSKKQKITKLENKLKRNEPYIYER